MFNLLFAQIGPRNAPRLQCIDKLPECKTRQSAGLAKGDAPQLEKLGGCQHTKLLTGFRGVNPRAGQQLFVNRYLQKRHVVTCRPNPARRNCRVSRPPSSAARPLPPSASPPSVLSVPSCNKSFRVFRVFRGLTLRCPSSAPTWAGKPMPRGTGFPARGFGTGPPVLRPPILPPLAPLALFRGQPAVRPVCKIFLPLKFSYLYGSDVGGRKIGWVRKFSGPNRSRALCSPPSAGSVLLPQLQRSVFNRRAGASVRQSPPCPSSVVL